MSLKEGMKAPAFKEQADYKGQWIVLYFYPKDDTPGCTREACGFQDLSKIFHEHNAVILGVSRDNAESHQEFKKKYKLEFPLLSDPDLSLHKAYGAYGEKTSYGKTSMGVIRSTFLIDPQGNIAKVWPNVKVDGHVEKVLEAIKNQ
ncbi:MAG: peroxiredoxin [Myxococcaceae bacterium]